MLDKGETRRGRAVTRANGLDLENCLTEIFCAHQENLELLIFFLPSIPLRDRLIRHFSLTPKLPTVYRTSIVVTSIHHGQPATTNELQSHESSCQ